MKAFSSNCKSDRFHSGLYGCAQTFFNRFDGHTNNFWISLSILLVVDALAVPYAGITHDARLYALQALSHLNPGYYTHDLFFLFGSQDDYSIFSILHAYAIDLLGLYRGTWFVYVINRIVYLAGLLFLFRTILNRNTVAFLAAYFVSAGFIHYIFFDVNEPFLTPRIVSAGLSIFAVAFLLRGKNITSICFLCLAGLFHPLMALGPGALVAVMLLLKGSIRIFGLLLIAGIAVSGIVLSVFPEWIHNLHLFAVMDSAWRDIVFTRSNYLAPLEWTPDEWRSVVASIIFTLLCMWLLTGTPRKLALVTCLIFVAGILVTFLTTYYYYLAFPIQIQLWRSFWLFRIMSIALAFFLGAQLWQENRFTRRMASIMIVLPACFYGGISDDSLFWLICAGFLTLRPWNLERTLSSPMKKMILILECLIILFVPAFHAMTNFTMFFSVTGLHETLFSFIAATGPFFGLVFLVILYWMFGTRITKRFLLPLVVSVFVFVTWTAPTPGTGYPAQIENEKFFFRSPESNILPEWRQIIPPGSTVLTTGIVPVESIWFDLKSSVYVSRVQGAGILFSRELAFEWQQRYRNMGNLAGMQNGEKLAAWCHREGIDFIFYQQDLPLNLISTHGRIRLYQVPPA